MVSASDILFNHGTSVAPLGLIAMKGAEELGNKLNDYLVNWAHKGGYDVDTFLIESECPRFSSGDGKGLIKSTVRGKDLFIIVDVGNYNVKYQMYDQMNAMSPDDHYQDLKRLIQAASGKAHRINVIMPILYGGRQHRRNYRESLDCACALQELYQMGVSNILTVDAHDPRVHNAIPLMGFDNMMPSYQVLKAMFETIPHLKTTPDEFMVISPDEGALNRNMYYASMLGVPMGMFYKRRDYSRVVDGRNPIVAHEFLGDSVEGKDVIIIDDMIASGESMIDVARQLKQRKAKRVYCIATFGLFTKGLEVFDKCHEEGLIEKVITTNLTYQMPDLFKKDWYESADMSKYIALIIDHLNHDASISELLDPAERINARIAEYKEKHTISDNYEM